LPDAVLESCKRVLDLDPQAEGLFADCSMAEAASRFLVAAYQDPARSNEAFAYYGAMQEKRPKDMAMQMAFLDLCLTRGDLDQAEKLSHRILEMNPKAPQMALINSTLAKVCIRKKNYSGAITFLGKVIEANPRDARALSDLAKVYRILKSYGEAMEAAMKAVEVDDTLVEPCVTLAASCLQMGNFSRAAQTARIAIEKSGSEPDPELITEAWSILAQAHEKNGEPEKAVEAYKNLLALNPPDKPALCRKLADLLEPLGRLPEAIEALQGWIAGNPQDVQALLRLSRIHLGQKEFRSAIGAASKALKANAESPEAHALLAECCFASTDYTRSVESARRALELQPGDARSQAVLIRALYASDQFDAALKQARQFLEANPDNTEVRLITGEMYFRKGAYEQALPHLEKGLAKEPDRPDSCFYLGMCHLKKGLFCNAVPLLEKATQLNPQSPEAWKGLGEALQESGREEDARTCRQRVDALSPNGAVGGL
jgi:tetratricopeptide (TPR) repeat protein